MPPSVGDAEPVNAPAAVANGEPGAAAAAAEGAGGEGEGGEGAVAGGSNGVEQPYQGKVSCLPAVCFEGLPKRLSHAKLGMISWRLVYWYQVYE